MPARPDHPRLSWTVHPAAREPASALGVAVVIVLAAALTSALTASTPLAVLAAAALAGSLRAFFLPRHYVLDEDGALEQGPLQATRRLTWAEVRSVTRERHGVHLSPLHRPSRWTPDRGLFLRTAGNADIVAAWALARRPAS
jgi:hypothetical protein